MMRSLQELTTEQADPGFARLDELSPLELVTVMNREDRRVAEAVGEVLPQVARAVEMIAAAFEGGGRLFYVGAGTSGRLGVLDAAECPPTFGVSADWVQGIIAGGDEALRRAVEGAEDQEADGAAAVLRAGVCARDVVCGLSASGRTPFVLGALRAARCAGARTIGVACNRPSEMENLADVMIAPATGPEVIAGSTRLKAGTAQKMILNMLSTGAMVCLGKVYGNLMVDVCPSNAKLVERAKRIIRVAAGVDDERASALYHASGGRPKVAIVMARRGCDAAEAARLLEKAGGRVRVALQHGA
ncbi:MAG: N-acetylmuramic acid 6-phosphate etherase [Armatimonadota bacterium]|nr:N-acetylmuramic acid 6-phosphate etherase [Armatimonadota bacterium]